MQVIVNPRWMLKSALALYLLILLGVLIFWPENWVDPSSVDIIIISLGALIGAVLVQLLYNFDLEDKQEEVDDFLTKSEVEIDQRKSELKLHIKHVKDREEFLLEAIDRLNAESSNETPASEPEEESEEVQEPEEESEEVQEPEEESEEVQEPEEEIEEKVDYKSMTVTQIKKILKEKGLPISGKKTDLIARLKE